MKRPPEIEDSAREYVTKRLYDTAGQVTGAALYAELKKLRMHPASRQTVYNWRTEWHRSRPKPGSEDGQPWGLASDTTGRPDIVFRVFGALAARAGMSPAPVVTQADARWLVRLAIAAPHYLTKEWWDEEGNLLVGMPEQVIWARAMRYVAAEVRGDAEAMRELERTDAVLYTGTGDLMALRSKAYGRQRANRAVAATEAE